MWTECSVKLTEMELNQPYHFISSGTMPKIWFQQYWKQQPQQLTSNNLCSGIFHSYFVVVGVVPLPVLFCECMNENSLSVKHSFWIGYLRSCSFIFVNEPLPPSLKVSLSLPLTLFFSLASIQYKVSKCIYNARNKYEWAVARPQRPKQYLYNALFIYLFWNSMCISFPSK